MGVGVGGNQDNRGWSRFCCIPLQCSPGIHFYSVPYFFPSLDPKLSPLS